MIKLKKNNKTINKRIHQPTSTFLVIQDIRSEYHKWKNDLTQFLGS